MPASPVGEGRQVTSARLLFNSRHYFIKENLYCPFSLSKVPNGQIWIFLGRGNERPAKWLCWPPRHFHRKFRRRLQNPITLSSENFRFEFHLRNAQSRGVGDSIRVGVVVSYLLCCWDSQLAQVYSPQVRREALPNATSLCCMLSC